MKVAIITISDGQNYGNRLQNFALQYFIKTLGIDCVETVRNPVRIRQDDYMAINSIIYNIKEMLRVFLGKNKFTYVMADIKRKKNFKKFTIEYINLSKYVIARDYIPNKLANEYDFFVVGSDQVWNPEFGIVTDIDFLTFAKPEKRISYAASFGISKLPDECKKNYKNMLSEMHSISVRENSGCKIIKDLLGYEVEVVLDPTLLISADTWRKFAIKPKKFNKKKYVLGYYLNGGNDKEREIVSSKAKEIGAEQVFLMDKSNPYMYSLNPFEFLWLIDNAEVVCTNSFHGTVFSILMGKTVICGVTKGFNENMSSRFDTLFEFCGVEKNNKNEIECKNIDLDNILANARNNAKNFLLSGFGLN